MQDAAAEKQAAIQQKARISALVSGNAPQIVAQPSALAAMPAITQAAPQETLSALPTMGQAPAQVTQPATQQVSPTAIATQPTGKKQTQEMLRQIAAETGDPADLAKYAASLSPTADERKQDANEKAEKERMASNVSRVEQFVIPGIDDAIDYAKKNYIAVNKTFGGVAKMIPGSKAYSLQEKLQPIKSALSLDKLQQMKDNSATGASGLGPLAVKELEALEKSVASLQIGQETKDLISNLRKVQKHYNAWVDIMKKANPEYLKTMQPAIGNSNLTQPKIMDFNDLP